MSPFPLPNDYVYVRKHCEGSSGKPYRIIRQSASACHKTFPHPKIPGVKGVCIDHMLSMNIQNAKKMNKNGKTNSSSKVYVSYEEDYHKKKITFIRRSSEYIGDSESYNFERGLLIFGKFPEEGEHVCSVTENVQRVQLSSDKTFFVLGKESLKNEKNQGDNRMNIGSFFKI